MPQIGLTCGSFFTTSLAGHYHGAAEGTRALVTRESLPRRPATRLITSFALLGAQKKIQQEMMAAAGLNPAEEPVSSRAPASKNLPDTDDDWIIESEQSTAPEEDDDWLIEPQAAQDSDADDFEADYNDDDDDDDYDWMRQTASNDLTVDRDLTRRRSGRAKGYEPPMAGHAAYAGSPAGAALTAPPAPKPALRPAHLDLHPRHGLPPIPDTLSHLHLAGTLPELEDIDQMDFSPLMTQIEEEADDLAGLQLGRGAFASDEAAEEDDDDWEIAPEPEAEIRPTEAASPKRRISPSEVITRTSAQADQEQTAQQQRKAQEHAATAKQREARAKARRQAQRRNLQKAAMEKAVVKPVAESAPQIKADDQWIIEDDLVDQILDDLHTETAGQPAFAQDSLLAHRNVTDATFDDLVRRLCAAIGEQGDEDRSGSGGGGGGGHSLLRKHLEKALRKQKSGLMEGYERGTLLWFGAWLMQDARAHYWSATRNSQRGGRGGQGGFASELGSRQSAA